MRDPTLALLAVLSRRLTVAEFQTALAEASALLAYVRQETHDHAYRENRTLLARLQGEGKP